MNAFLVSLLVLLSIDFAACRQKKQGHKGQKKQFVQFNNLYGDSDAFARGYGGYLGEGEDDDINMGQMQLTESNMGGLSLNNGDNMDSSLASLFGGDQSSFPSLGSIPVSNIQSFTGGDSGAYTEQAISRGDSIFSSLGNSDTDDSFTSQLGGGNSAFSYNLGDSINGGDGIGQLDINSLYNGNDNGLLDGFGGGALSSPLHHHAKGSHSTKQEAGEDRQGMGFDDVSSLLQSELGQLGSSDEKLQKLLESGLSDSTFGDAGTDDGNGIAVNLFGSPQDALDSQPSSSPDEIASFQQQQQVLNQLAGTMTAGALGGVSTGETVFGHASDKPDRNPKDNSAKEEAKQTALQVQKAASDQHKAKLKKLKNRLDLLKDKLQQLEAEQAKKSTSNQNSDPKTARNDAIKKLLIKNLKLAALIASKEIQLEEAKGKGLAYLSGKKEDSQELAEDLTGIDVSPDKAMFKKPLTELSKKAEEEVNHLSRNPDLDRIRNKTPELNSTLLAKKSSAWLKRINETLTELGKSVPSKKSELLKSSKTFLGRLQRQMASLLPSQGEAIQDRALAALYTELKAKQLIQARKKSKIATKPKRIYRPRS